MRDPNLASLFEAAMGPFPDGLAGAEIDGIDLVLLDEAVMGLASDYRRNARGLSPEDRDRLIASLADLDNVLDRLPSDDARSYFARTKAVGQYLLQERVDDL